jgi:mannosyltransferase
MNFVSPDDVVAIAPVLGPRYSGINSTLDRVVPCQAASLHIAAVGSTVSRNTPQIRIRDIWSLWKLPPGLPFRVWHARRNDDMLAGIFLRDIMRMPLKLVFTSAAQRAHTLLTRFLISRMDAVIATSPESASYLKRPCVVIPHGMDTQEFRPATDRAALRAKYKLPDTLLIGCFGRIRPDKGTDLFLEAFRRIARENPNVHAVITGLAKSNYAKFVQAMRDGLERDGLSARVTWLGEVEAAAVPELYRCMDIYMAPQRWEGFGVTPLEAMSSGVPVVATTVGAFRSQIVDGETGFLIPPEDLPAMVAAMERLIGDPALRKRMGAAGRERVTANFGIESEASAINKVYAGLWEAHAAGRVSSGQAAQAQTRKP